MFLFKGYEEGLEVDKIDRKGRKFETEKSDLCEFLEEGHLCVDGASVKEYLEKVVIKVKKTIDGEFRAVIVLSRKDDVERFLELVGDRVVEIYADEVSCKICVGILFGYGSKEFDNEMMTKYPGFGFKLEVEKLKNGARINDQFVDHLWVE